VCRANHFVCERSLRDPSGESLLAESGIPVYLFPIHAFFCYFRKNLFWFMEEKSFAGFRYESRYQGPRKSLLLRSFTLTDDMTYEGNQGRNVLVDSLPDDRSIHPKIGRDQGIPGGAIIPYKGRSGYRCLRYDGTCFADFLTGSSEHPISGRWPIITKTMRTPAVLYPVKT